tara:strand:+ start:241 stop:450 length:210 start_codon:yes stop_codon:yes gene_type:complete
MTITVNMSSEMKFKNHSLPEGNNISKSRVKLTDLVTRLNEEKKKERNSNIALSVAAVSAVTVFGIILAI